MDPDLPNESINKQNHSTLKYTITSSRNNMNNIEHLLLRSDLILCPEKYSTVHVRLVELETCFEYSSGNTVSTAEGKSGLCVFVFPGERTTELNNRANWS